ncbi:hypothetical protein H310_07191 [Aphanomyces invadans]|uniref:Uncharacterized protein n=1 Tax=Aphanomyces invadans TaxID=157072 RepID=A0A024U317_9STRA|nr:hypothetical protein H310_07191 [Aphanomyces invadans]ETW00620.1 hypothetical protein H310_07191 [Aphanomyces invadans]|eukprot:XP_008870755.1 hypothetical protein H310_07191 [Aphanomyces invadans]
MSDDDDAHTHDVETHAQLTPKAKKARRAKRTSVDTPKRGSLWDDKSVHELFRLRYKSQLAKRFDSKNNAEKKAA